MRSLIIIAISHLARISMQKLRYYLFACFFILSSSINYAQDFKPPVLNIGDNAPPLCVKTWLKGTPIEKLENGKTYVVEFWATWCASCIGISPHVSALANKYKNQVTFLGVDVLEKNTTTIDKIKSFVDRMGAKMDYTVAKEDSNLMATNWLKASGLNGIPYTYVINEEGKIAWIGFPGDLDSVLSAVANHTWNIQNALAIKNEQDRLEAIDHASMDTLNTFAGTNGGEAKILKIIDDIVEKEPKLKYAPIISSMTFSSLLKIDLNKAIKYGKELLSNPNFEGVPAYYSIFGVVDSYWYQGKFDLPTEIYALAAEACQAEIDRYPWITKSRYFYHKLADWYFRGGNKIKAVQTEQIAIEQLKAKKDGLQGNLTSNQISDLTAYQIRLEQYKKM